MRRVLVTGAAGYIGSHACKALARAGFEPIGLDSLERAGLRELPWGVLETGDIADRNTLARMFATYAPEALMHFAAYTYVGESVTQPALYYRNNVCSSLALLEAARAAGIGTVVFSSSCAIYGLPVSLPIDEDHPQNPINPYGAGKLMVERILGDYAHAYGLRYAALRYFNAAGADLQGDLGECHEPETHVIPLAIRTALGEQPEFEIYGADYPTADGTANRDYVHVADLADAHVRALRYLADGSASVALNLGTGTGHSVRQIVRAVEAETGRPIRTRRVSRRAGDPPELVANPLRAQRLLGWQASFSSLGEIVRTAVQWHRRWRATAPPAESNATDTGTRTDH